MESFAYSSWVTKKWNIPHTQQTKEYLSRNDRTCDIDFADYLKSLTTIWKPLTGIFLSNEDEWKWLSMLEAPSKNLQKVKKNVKRVLVIFYLTLKMIFSVFQH